MSFVILSKRNFFKMKSLANIVTGFKDKKVLIIGDVMLDKYLFGNVSRVASEAPVQVVNAQSSKFIPGGAANCALNIASLGGKAFLCSIIGSDEHSKILQNILYRNNIDLSAVNCNRNCKTIVKERIISNNQQLIRIDYEDTKPYNDINKSVIYKKLKRVISKVDSILISDYCKGLINKDLIDFIKKNNVNKIPIIVDPKPQNKLFYKDMTLITPNYNEAKEMSNGNSNLRELGLKLVHELNTNVLITRGPDGMSLFNLDGSIVDIATEAREINDVTGAGDTVAATIALSLASKTNMNQAIILANHAASIVLAKFGTASVSASELLRKISLENQKIKTINELIQISQSSKKLHQKIVFTNCCFDIIHPGHTRFLKEAKRLGHILIVAINSDSSVKKLKGNTRPLINENERAEVLSSLEYVDYVTIFDELEPSKIIRLIKPDICTKGGDTKVINMPKKEKEAINQVKCNLMVLPKYEEYSTNRIINKINNM